MKNLKPCLTCKGTMKVASWRGEGTQEPCRTCSGTGSFEEPDYRTLLASLFTRRGGGGTWRFRASFPSANRFTDLAVGRSYYLWRMIRFHGGVDVTLPMTAAMVTRGDPWVTELDAVARGAAERIFGTCAAGTTRWQTALGCLDRAPEGLPATAYTGGPVVTGEKPDWEALELK